MYLLYPISQIKKRSVFLFLLFLININALAIQISGFVRDGLSGEVLIGATVWVKDQNIGTITDNRGYFNLLAESPCSLSFSYIGFVTQHHSILQEKDSMLTINMESGLTLNEITLTAPRERIYDKTRLSAKELSRIPTLGAKPDIIKALQLLPGVQTHSEGMSLMMVRGGEPGQNLYLLDNVPLIYVNHLGGFLSVFNPDMINTVDFYKGNFPARQGGKLSSIVDITQREGDISKHRGSFSLGITDASFCFEGPLFNKKMSYIVTARKTLTDALLAGFSTLSDGNYAVVSYGFHDINAKLSYKPDERNSLSLNLYQGDDYLNYWTKPWKMNKDEKSHLNQTWGNWLISGRWNRVLHSKLYIENILSFSRYRNKYAQKYRYKAQEINKRIEMMYKSSVNDLSFRTAWKYYFFKNWDIEFGGHLGFLVYKPNFNYNSGSGSSPTSDEYNSIESALYLDNKIRIIPGLMIQPSMRLSNFSNKGENFPEIEPRINLSYSFNSNQSLNINYMRVSQNSHLVFTQTQLLKREVWLPATSELPPEISNQYSLSWNGNFEQSKYSAETNIYYKKMEQLVTLKEGHENSIDIAGIENKIEKDGVGTAYGAEFMIKKNSGQWTGALSYGFSYADRTFATINNGETYEFDFNRPHSFSLNLNHDLNNNWNMSLVWIIQSGTPYTPALGKQYTIDPETGITNIELVYGPKNSQRMQAYHRLDLGFNHHITTKRGNKAVWTYSIYNVYNRINPYDYYYDNDKSRENPTYFSEPLKLYKIGLFTLIPSIAYKVFF